MEEETKKRLHQFEIIGAVVLLLVSVISLFPDTGITGYVSVDVRKQPVDIAVANSQSYLLTTTSEEGFELTSFKISGELIGEGKASVYLDNGQGQKILVFTNIIDSRKGLGSVTGMKEISGLVTGPDTEAQGDLILEYLENIDGSFRDLKDQEELFSGKFEEKCVDSCFINMPLNSDLSYLLLFYVEEGAILNINEVVYTAKQE